MRASVASLPFRSGKKNPAPKARGLSDLVSRLERQIQPKQYLATHDVIQVRLVSRELGNRVGIRIEDVADRSVDHHGTEAHEVRLAIAVATRASPIPQTS